LKSADNRSISYCNLFPSRPINIVRHQVRLFALFAILVSLSFHVQVASGQQPTSSPMAEAASSQPATSISTSTCSTAFTQMLERIGWVGPNSKAFHANGSLTHGPETAGQTQSSIVIWADSTGSYRSEIENAGVTRLTIASNGHGLRKSSAGSKNSHLSTQGAQSAQQWMAPWLALDQQLPLHHCSQPESKSSANLSLIGYRFEPINSMRDVRPAQKPPAFDSTFTVWLNPVSALPDHIDFFLPASDNPYAGTWVSRYFKDFQAVHGVMVPRTEELVAGGNIITRLHFDQVELIDQLPSSLFDELQVAER
jgi:hypothetical protein